MFTKIEIENFYGINNKLTLDFVTKSRNRLDSNSFFSIENKSVNKLVGILGGNSTGKSSIIHAIGFIGNFLDTPLTSARLDEMISKLEEKEDINDIEKNHALSLLKSYAKGPNFNNQNVDSNNDTSTILVEMYISSNNSNFSGFYQYTLSFNGKFNFVEKESLKFKKNIKNVYKEIVFNTQDTKSKVGELCHNYYNLKKMNQSLDESNENIIKFKFCDTFISHYLNNSKICTSDTIENLEEHEIIEELYKEENINFYSKVLNVIDNRLNKFILINDRVYVINRKQNKLKYSHLSDGTKRCLSLVKMILEVTKNNGVLVIDELELNLSIDLIEVLLNIFLENKCTSQLIFTSNMSQVFDVLNQNNEKIFKQDMIQVLSRKADDDDSITIQKLLDIRIDGKRIKNLSSINRLYSGKKISIHPTTQTIKDIIDTYKNIQNF